MNFIIIDNSGNQLTGKKLSCHFEPNNAFDRFVIKVVQENGHIVGHLPREISRVTKLYLDRGAKMNLELTSKHYRRSPLVQGGMEIACQCFVRMPATLRNVKITEKYLQLVKVLYTDPKEEEILGCFVTEIGNVCPSTHSGNASKANKNRLKSKKNEPKQLDIREMLKKR